MSTIQSMRATIVEANEKREPLRMVVDPPTWPITLDGGIFERIEVESPVGEGLIWVFTDESQGYDRYSATVEEPPEETYAEQYEIRPEDSSIAVFTGGSNQSAPNGDPSDDEMAAGL